MRCSAPEAARVVVCTIHPFDSSVIYEAFGIDPDAVPAVLVKQHGPFTWGPTAAKAVETAKILEVVAEMNYHALQLTRADIRVPQYLLDKHYYRKHGANAYYGQKK